MLRASCRRDPRRLIVEKLLLEPTEQLQGAAQMRKRPGGLHGKLYNSSSHCTTRSAARSSVTSSSKSEPGTAGR
jgi:hypothetical protein